MTAPRKINGVSVDLMEQYRTYLKDTALRSCESKNRYADEFAARAVGTQAMGKTGHPLFIYRCKLCRGWHLTKVQQAPYFSADYFTRGTT